MQPKTIAPRKRWTTAFGIFFGIAIGSLPLSATPFHYTREATPQTITVGDIVDVRVTVTHGKDTQVTPDAMSLSDIFLLRSTQHSTTTSGNATVETWIYQIAVFEPGKHRIPESRLRQRLANGNTVIHTLPAIGLSVVSLLPATASAVGSLKPLMDVSLTLWPWLIGLTCLSLGLWWLLRRYRNRHRPVYTDTTPVLSPKEEAMAAIDTLTTSGTIERGDYDMACSAITDILKRFLSRHYQKKMQEMTSSEVIATLRDMALAPWIHTDIQELFSKSDYVKFAHADSSAQACYQLISTLKNSIAEISALSETASTEETSHP